MRLGFLKCGMSIAKPNAEMAGHAPELLTLFGSLAVAMILLFVGRT
jgi:hypothetical protein